MILAVVSAISALSLTAAAAAEALLEGFVNPIWMMQ
jgi:hypothetical protein